jgi:drug/metabolite transporter (DMT)-like permease
MWLSYALMSALLLAVRRVFEKRLTGEFGNFSLSLFTLSFSLVPTLLLFFFFPIPHDLTHLSAHFWAPLAFIWIVLYPLQNYLLYRALREGELSQVTPVSALLPVFNIATSFFLIGEAPSSAGYAGIALTVVATYLLLTDLYGARGPMLNKPVLLMVGSVLCTALGSTLDKIAIDASTPVFYAFVNMLGASVVFTVLSYWYGEFGDVAKLRAHYKTFVFLGFVFALAFAGFASAFMLGPTSYVLAVRSLGLILPALWGIAVLREGISWRKICSIVLFCGGTLALALG